jgi:hypothetical protein
MFFVQRSLLSSSIVLALAATCSVTGGCRDEAASNAAASASASPEAQSAGAKAPTAQVNIDPVITKTYRVEACYYGALAFHQARVAYLGSLNGAEPGPDKIPEFGAVVDEPAGGRPPVPAVSGSAAPASSSAPKPAEHPKPAPSAKPAGSAAPTTTGSAPLDKNGKPMDMNKKIRQVRYEYFARMCKTAAGIKTPASPELDTVLNDATGADGKVVPGYSTFLMNLSKDISDANTYYQKDGYKEDNFAKGKELHAKIVEQFKKLDDYDKKFADALAAYKTANPIDHAGWGESRTLADAIIGATRDIYQDLDTSKVDAAKAKSDLAKLDAAIDGLKKYGTDHKDAQDPYAQIVAPAGDRVSKQIHDILDAPDFKAALPHQMVALATFFEQVLDGNYRALIKQLRTDAGGPPAFGDPKMQRPRMPAGHPMMPARPPQQ